MASRWQRLVIFVWLLLPACVVADEAIDKHGRRFLGTLQTRSFQVADTGMPRALDQLQFVRFPEHSTPVPSCKITHQLLLAGEQRLTGDLHDVGPKDVRFRIVTGEILTLPRRQTSRHFASGWQVDSVDRRFRRQRTFKRMAGKADVQWPTCHVG